MFMPVRTFTESASGMDVIDKFNYYRPIPPRLLIGFVQIQNTVPGTKWGGRVPPVPPHGYATGVLSNLIFY